MTDGVTLSGAYTLAGRSVAVMIAGLDAGTYSVGSDGSFFVPFGSDPDGLLTAAYLSQVSNPASLNPALVPIAITNRATSDVLTVYVPVLIGYPYTSIGKRLRPMTEAETKTKQGPSLGDRKQSYWWAGLFQSAQGVSVGTGTGQLFPVPFTAADENTLLTKDTLFSGIVSRELADGSTFDSQLLWQITRPYACTVVSLGQFLATEER